MIRHQRQLREHCRELSKLEAVRLRAKSLLVDLRLEDLGLLRPMDQRVEKISKEISEYSERSRRDLLSQLNLLSLCATCHEFSYAPGKLLAGRKKSRADVPGIPESRLAFLNAVVMSRSR